MKNIDIRIIEELKSILCNINNNNFKHIDTFEDKKINLHNKTYILRYNPLIKNWYIYE